MTESKYIPLLLSLISKEDAPDEYFLKIDNETRKKRIKYSESSPVPFCDATKDIIIIAYQAQPNALERITALLGELKV